MVARLNWVVSRWLLLCSGWLLNGCQGVFWVVVVARVLWMIIKWLLGCTGWFLGGC